MEGQEEKIPLETYITGVVAAEMPVSFKKEALKAQAIAARTYALKTTNYGKTAIAPTVARQVFYDEEQRKANWVHKWLRPCLVELDQGPQEVTTAGL